MPKKPIILIGGGGHCKSCIDVIESTGEWDIKGILDKNIRVGERVLNYTVAGNDEDIDKMVKNGYFFLITVGQIKSAAVREMIYQNLKLRNARIATIISAKATVSRYAEIGEGTIVHHGSIINANSVIGENNIINTGAGIEHDVRIGNNNHISTYSILNGDVKVGNGCFIGSGAIVGNGVEITDNVVIGAGSLVLKNIEYPGIYAGAPIKQLGK